MPVDKILKKLLMNRQTAAEMGGPCHLVDTVEQLLRDRTTWQKLIEETRQDIRL